MSASAATRLRQLATQYHGGEIDLQSYRRLRAELLDRLTSADVDAEEPGTTLPQRTRPVVTAPAPATAPVHVHAPVPVPAPPPPRPQAVTEPQPGSAPQAKPAPVARKGGAGGIVITIIVIAALALGAVWYFYLRAPLASSGAAAEQADATPESYHAINDFLAADDWSDEQIANFNTRWATLPDEMRDSALDQPWYQDFVERVRSQVKERRALTATAESAGSVEGPLSALASSVGIDISSPDTIVPPRARVTTNDAVAMDKTAAMSASQHPSKNAAQPAQSAAASAPAKTAAPSTAGSGKSAPSLQQAASGSRASPPMTPGSNPDRCRIELVGSRKPRCRDALSVGGFGPFLAVVPAGAFQMGNKDVAQEQPVHGVRIAKPFAIAEHETSQGEFALFCTETKRGCEAQPWSGDDFPVVRVDWQDARDYVTWLSKVSGNTYRLATEAEWEFAARGGGTALYPSGTSLAPTDAVFSHTDKLTAPWPRSHKINANTSAANTFRLYHSIGNVREWVEDAWSANYSGAPDDGSARRNGDSALRVVRGGAYSDPAAKLRFTTREGLDPSTRDAMTGFRVVREL